jgi:hypothetical protein
MIFTNNISKIYLNKYKICGPNLINGFHVELNPRREGKIHGLMGSNILFLLRIKRLKDFLILLNLLLIALEKFGFKKFS